MEIDSSIPKARLGLAKKRHTDNRLDHFPLLQYSLLSYMHISCLPHYLCLLHNERTILKGK